MRDGIWIVTTSLTLWLFNDAPLSTAFRSAPTTLMMGVSASPHKRSTSALFPCTTKRTIDSQTALWMSKDDTENDSSSDPLSRDEALRRMLQQDGIVDDNESSDAATSGRRNLIINVVAAGLLSASGLAAWELFSTNVYTPAGFQRYPNLRFLAALGDPKATSGTISPSEPWGLWTKDPGPRGVFLRDCESTFAATTTAPAGWTLDPNDFWLEEHGIIMEAPSFPLAPGRYLVTGGRQVTTGLVVEASGRWTLEQGTLYDVTHLPCRSARYRGGSVTTARQRSFPVAPGAVMPPVEGCAKQDYAVLFVVGRDPSYGGDGVPPGNNVV